MGLTKASTGNKILIDNLSFANCDYTVAIARQP